MRRSLRDKYRYHEKNFPDWYSGDIPSVIIDDVIAVCCKNYKNAFSHLKSGVISRFKIKYKIKKEIAQSITLSKNLFSQKKNSFSMKYIGKYLKSAVPFKNKIKGETKLQYDQVLDTFHLVIPVECVDDKQVPCTGRIALDPGKRKFLTGYSPGDHVIEVGNGSWKVIEKHYKEIDILNSKKDLTDNKKKKLVYRRCAQRKWRRIRNLRDELHWKTINFLTARYKTIFLGDMSSKRVSSKKLFLDKNSKRALAHFGFYLFRQRLEERCKNTHEYFLVNEAFTSKTCSACGEIGNPGRSEVFRCGICNYTTDRDYNGARNIYLKGWPYLEGTSWLD